MGNCLALTTPRKLIELSCPACLETLAAQLWQHALKCPRLEYTWQTVTLAGDFSLSYGGALPRLVHTRSGLVLWLR